jgi:hypothetical protein
MIMSMNPFSVALISNFLSPNVKPSQKKAEMGQPLGKWKIK